MSKAKNGTRFGVLCPLTGTFTSESIDPEVARILRNKKLDFVPKKNPEVKIERPVLKLVRFNPDRCTPQAKKNLIAFHEVNWVGRHKAFA
jgi:hypothetical protein